MSDEVKLNVGKGNTVTLSISPELTKIFKDIGENTKKLGAGNIGLGGTGDTFNEIKSRGGNLNRHLQPEENHIRLDAEDFNDSVKHLRDISRPLHYAGSKLVDTFKSLYDKTTVYGKLLEDSSGFVRRLEQSYKDMGESVLTHIGEGGNVGDIKDTVDALAELKDSINKVVNNVNALNDVQGAELKSKINNIKLGGKNLNILKTLNTEHRHTLFLLNQNTVIDGELRDSQGNTIRTSEQLNDALKALSESTSKSAKVVGSIGMDVTSKLTAIQTQFLNKLKVDALLLSSASVYTVTNLYKDFMAQFQTSVPSSFRLLSATLGTSPQETMFAALKYRDVLRQQSVLMGKDVFDEDNIKEIGVIGKKRGYTGNQSLDYGFKLMETSKLLGISSKQYAMDVENFQAEAAKTLNMTTGEFGEYFNELSKDPDFIGYTSTMGAKGSEYVDSLLEEMTIRTKMNKALGLTTESLKRNLAFENQKRTSGIAETIKRQIAMRMMTKVDNKAREKFGIPGMSKEDQVIYDQAQQFGVQSLSDTDRDKYLKTIQYQPNLTYSVLSEKYTTAISDARNLKTPEGDAEARRLGNEYLTYKNMHEVARNIGETGFNLEEGDLIKQSAKSFDISPEEMLTQMAKGEFMGDIASKLNTRAGGSEPPPGNTFDDGVARFGMAVDTFVSGIKSSGFLGVISALGHLGLTLVHFGTHVALTLGAAGAGAAGAAGLGIGAYMKSAFKTSTDVFKSIFSFKKAPNVVAGGTEGLAAEGIVAETTAAAGTKVSRLSKLVSVLKGRKSKAAIIAALVAGAYQLYKTSYMGETDTGTPNEKEYLTKPLFNTEETSPVPGIPVQPTTAKEKETQTLNIAPTEGGGTPNEKEYLTKPLFNTEETSPVQGIPVQPTTAKEKETQTLNIAPTEGGGTGTAVTIMGATVGMAVPIASKAIKEARAAKAGEAIVKPTAEKAAKSGILKWGGKLLGKLFVPVISSIEAYSAYKDGDMHRAKLHLAAAGLSTAAAIASMTVAAPAAPFLYAGAAGIESGLFAKDIYDAVTDTTKPSTALVHGTPVSTGKQESNSLLERQQRQLQAVEGGSGWWNNTIKPQSINELMKPPPLVTGAAVKTANTVLEERRRKDEETTVVVEGEVGKKGKKPVELLEDSTDLLAQIAINTRGKRGRDKPPPLPPQPATPRGMDKVFGSLDDYSPYSENPQYS